MQQGARGHVFGARQHGATAEHVVHEHECDLAHHADGHHQWRDKPVVAGHGHDVDGEETLNVARVRGDLAERAIRRWLGVADVMTSPEEDSSRGS